MFPEPILTLPFETMPFGLWASNIILAICISTDEWMLRKFHTNNLAVEVQLFWKFISRRKVCTTTWPNTELADVLKTLLTDLIC